MSFCGAGCAQSFSCPTSNYIEVMLLLSWGCDNKCNVHNAGIFILATAYICIALLDIMGLITLITKIAVIPVLAIAATMAITDVMAIMAGNLVMTMMALMAKIAFMTIVNMMASTSMSFIILH